MEMTNSKYLANMTDDTYYYDIKQAANDYEIDIQELPFTIRILLENILRHTNNSQNISNILHWQQNIGSDVNFYPTRILLQDYTGIPCVVDLASMRDAAKSLGLNPEVINPKIPVDLVIDHSVQIDSAGNPAAMAYNIEKEYHRNSERYKFLKWAQKSLNNFQTIPPDTGIIHQINIEYLSHVVVNKVTSSKEICYPDSVFGTDSHTTMINGLGVLGWGVGGIEAEACMLGEASIFSMPEVIGVKLINKLPAGTVATDLALEITRILREQNVVGKFVEYFGPGYENLSLADRATIANMSPEYGSTCGYFPIDETTLNYLKLTGRNTEKLKMIETYTKTNQLFYNSTAASKIKFTKVIEIDLSKLDTGLAGPKRPQDRVALGDLPNKFEEAISLPAGNHGFGLNATALNDRYDFELDDQKESLKTGDVLIAAITSCTNTSNPEVLIGAGLLAKKAVENGLTVSSKVKTSFAPGSQAVTKYLEESGLMPFLNQLGFNIIAYGCTTCIGNSGPLAPEIEAALKKSDIVAGAVLSGNRNFEGRIHPLIKANYLASPLLVVAYALAGNLRVNLQTDLLGTNKSGQSIFLKDIWPVSDEINQYIKQYISSNTYRSAYQNIFSGTKQWDALEVLNSENFDWSNQSTYLANPPYFNDQINHQNNLPGLKNMRVLAMLGDSVTTDHISPAGVIPIDSPAGEYLHKHGIKPKDFNTYGSRRGNHHVMARGTLANPRLHNALALGKEGGFTTYFPTNEVMSIFTASQKYLQNQTELVILAGRDYGMGSSRDWAAKGVKLLGVKAVIAQSFERIHRSNLAMMGLVPLTFESGESAEKLGLNGTESLEIHLPQDMHPKQKVKVTATDNDGNIKEFNTILRFDSPAEIEYFYTGGILNKVLNDKSKVDQPEI